MASVVLEIVPVGKLRYLLIVDYSAYFIAGATCYLVWSRGVSLYRMGILAASYCLALFHAIGEIPGFEKYYHVDMSTMVVTAVVTVFFAVMLLVSLGQTSIFGRRRWQVVGTLTYPLYLLHQNIGYMVFNTAYPNLDIDFLFWTTCIAMILLAHSVHVVVERRYAETFQRILARAFDTSGSYLARLWSKG